MPCVPECLLATVQHRGEQAGVLPLHLYGMLCTVDGSDGQSLPYVQGPGELAADLPVIGDGSRNKRLLAPSILGLWSTALHPIKY